MDPKRNLMRYNRTMSGASARMPIYGGMCAAAVNDGATGVPDCSSEDQQILGYSLSMVYAPKQCFGSLYDLRSALSYGTIFKELNLPFAPGKRN